MYACIIEPSGAMYLTEIEDSVDALQGVVGGSFDAVYSSTGNTTFWVHDEGKLLGQKANYPATRMLWELNPRFDGQDYLAGTVLITGGADGGGNTLSITSEAINFIKYMHMLGLADLKSDTKDDFFKDLGL